MINHLVYNNFELNKNNILLIANKYDSRIAEFIDLAQSSDINELILDDYTMGYTLKTLATALWALWHSESFEDGLLSVVNAGGDADTNGAVTCSILGAKYGYSSIPTKYINGLTGRNILQTTADKLYNIINK